MSAIMKLLMWANTIQTMLLRVPLLGWLIEYSTTFLACLSRGFTGLYVTVPADAPRPHKPLKLYEYEGCPFCKKVRETLSYLDLDAHIFPTPRETLKAYGVIKDSRYRPAVKDIGGQVMFPFLVDDNTGKKMYNSDDIVAYLHETYGKGAAKPLALRVLSKLPSAFLFLPNLFRARPECGALRIPSKKPKVALEFWGYEADPESKMVRELLTSLELEHMLHTTALGSPTRQTLAARRGGMWKKLVSCCSLGLAPMPMVPYLEDANTGFRSGCVRNILAYLVKEYKTGDMVKEDFSDYSTKGASSAHGTIPGKNKKE